jgi:acyl carrier protein
MISENYIDEIKSIILDLFEEPYFRRAENQIRTHAYPGDYSRGINLMNNTVLSNLGIDSLDGVELMIRLEAEFDISISDDMAEKLISYNTTVEDVIKFIESFFVKEIRELKIKKLNS